ncbi:MAG TPA: TatD family hydrolase [Longimicrobiales bacterium]|nr:TatD family hydrolase [Longimicrobiales bacterium]
MTRGVTAEYFDSHCHLTDAAFREDREAVLLRASESGVTRLVTIASSVADAREALALTRDGVPRVWCTAGVHPHEASGAGPGDVEAVRALATEHDEVVAIGETGLDFHYDSSPRDVQRELFDAHLALGAETGLPVVVHAREADDDVAAALRRMPAGATGVLHCFTGGPKAFAEAMAAGWYVSFAGIASFKSFAAVELLREVPPDRLLVETDSPYLAPVPRRGRRNEPAFVPHVVEAVARHLGADPAEVASRTTDNACRFYGVS